MEHIDTKGLGAGSYPEPPEPKDNLYRLKIIAYGYVNSYGKDAQDAYRNIEEKNLEIEELEELVDWEVLD